MPSVTTTKSNAKVDTSQPSAQDCSSESSDSDDACSVEEGGTDESLEGLERKLTQNRCAALARSHKRCKVIANKFVGACSILFTSTGVSTRANKVTIAGGHAAANAMGSQLAKDLLVLMGGVSTGNMGSASDAKRLIHRAAQDYLRVHKSKASARAPCVEAGSSKQQSQEGSQQQSQGQSQEGGDASGSESQDESVSAAAPSTSQGAARATAAPAAPASPGILTPKVSTRSKRVVKITEKAAHNDTLVSMLATKKK